MLATRAALRAEMEAEPVRFLSRELDDRLDAARAALAAFLGADADDLAFVTNATSGVNAVLRSRLRSAGDELLTTDHAYRRVPQCARLRRRRAAARAWSSRRCRSRCASPDEVVDAVLARVTPRTRLALLDHVTSPTGLVLPIERLIAELGRRGIDVLVDGAHAPGMLPLDLDALGATYYSGNCHKWLCAPKGSAFLWVRRDRQPRGAAADHQPRRHRDAPGRSRFRLEFDWTGTSDPTAWLTRARRRSSTSARSCRAAGRR